MFATIQTDKAIGAPPAETGAANYMAEFPLGDTVDRQIYVYLLFFLTARSFSANAAKHKLSLAALLILIP
jgi:hypothetical protein